jgi:hypothetical protein
MNIPEAYIVIACVFIIAGCALGHWSGYKAGVNTGWERCRWEMGMRQAAADSARRDPATGRYRKAQR